MRNGEVALEKYVITKTLTKPPEDYPDAKSQPHVQVRLSFGMYLFGKSLFGTDSLVYLNIIFRWL